MDKSEDADRYNNAWELMIRSLFAQRHVVLCVRLVLGGVFIIASIDKISYPETFAISIEAYKILPVAIINIMALIIPWMELLCGIFLIGGTLRRASAAILALLLCIFIIALGSALARDLVIDCGCFGPAHATPVGWGKIMEDVGLLILAIWLVVLPEQGTLLPQSAPEATGRA